jgi:hypothetical protein
MILIDATTSSSSTPFPVPNSHMPPSQVQRKRTEALKLQCEICGGRMGRVLVHSWHICQADKLKGVMVCLRCRTAQEVGLEKTEPNEGRVGGGDATLGEAMMGGGGAQGGLFKLRYEGKVVPRPMKNRKGKNSKKKRKKAGMEKKGKRGKSKGKSADGRKRSVKKSEQRDDGMESGEGMVSTSVCGRFPVQVP